MSSGSPLLKLPKRRSRRGRLWNGWKISLDKANVTKTWFPLVMTTSRWRGFLIKNLEMSFEAIVSDFNGKKVQLSKIRNSSLPYKKGRRNAVMYDWVNTVTPFAWEVSVASCKMSSLGSKRLKESNSEKKLRAVIPEGKETTTPTFNVRCDIWLCNDMRSILFSSKWPKLSEEYWLKKLLVIEVTIFLPSILKKKKHTS